MKILQIDSSSFGSNSVSRQLTAAIVAELKKQAPDATVTYRDLAVDLPPHVTEDLLPVTKLGKREDLTPAQKEEAERIETYLGEFLSADVIVVGAPMYNFSVPTQLRSWMDRLAQPGRTFTYTAEGPKGLAGGRRIIVASSRGGVYTNAPQPHVMDHQESYLKAFLGFIGVTDVVFVRAEGAAMGPEAREKGIAAALASIPAALPQAA